jgi:hypothetical protein
MSQVSNTPSPPNDLQAAILNIPITNTLLNTSVVAIVCKSVKIKFDGIDLQTHVHDPNFILYLCNCLEVAFANAKKDKVNKRDVLMQILTELNLPKDYDTIVRIVEFLHSTHAITKIEEAIVESTPILKRCLNFFLKSSYQ